MFESTVVDSALPLLRSRTSLGARIRRLSCSLLGCQGSTEPLGAWTFLLYLAQCPSSSGRHPLSNRSSSPLLFTLRKSGVSTPCFVLTSNFSPLYSRLCLPSLIVSVYVGRNLLVLTIWLLQFTILTFPGVPKPVSWCVPPYEDCSGCAD